MTKELFTAVSHPSEDFWPDLTRLANAGSDYHKAMSDFISAFDGQDPPPAEVDAFLSNNKREVHAGVDELAMTLWLHQQAARQGLSGAEAVESLIRTSPSSFDTDILRSHAESLAKLLNPPGDTNTRAAVSAQRRLPLPILNRITFGWDARAVFVPRDKGTPELIGFVPILLASMSVSKSRQTTETVAFQLDEVELSNVIDAFSTARDRLEEMRQQMAGSHHMFRRDSDAAPDETEEWHFNI
jgi:hypothetical protein